MSDTTPDDKTTGDQKPKPIFNPDDVVEPAVDFGPADPTPAEVAVEEPAVEEPAVEAPMVAAPVVEEPVTKPTKKSRSERAADAAAAASATGQVAPVEAGATSTGAAATDAAAADAAATDPSFAGREVVYVQAPVPPRLRGNRGVGSALALLGAVVFAAVYAGAMIIAFFLRGDAPMVAFAQFIQNAAFWVPVLVFLVSFVLLVLVVNRGGWAAHVFGSLLVAIVVYFGSIGILLLLGQIVGAASGASGITFAGVAGQPFIIIAALVAREVSIWMGLAIAARGRRVKAKNIELVDEWEQEHAETKAQYERAGATT